MLKKYLKNGFIQGIYFSTILAWSDRGIYYDESNGEGWTTGNRCY